MPTFRTFGSMLSPGFVSHHFSMRVASSTRVREIAVDDDRPRRARDVNAGNRRRRLASRRDGGPQGGGERPTRQ